MSTRHFLLTDNNAIEEFSEEQAWRVAAGSDTLPRFAEKQLRYVQVEVDDEISSEGELKVRTLGAIVKFDENGRMYNADSTMDQEQELTHFEHDACVQFALKDRLPNYYELDS